MRSLDCTPHTSALNTTSRQSLLRKQLGDLIREEKLLWVYCCDCCHERDINPATVPLDAPVREWPNLIGAPLLSRGSSYFILRSRSREHMRLNRW